MLSKNKLSLPWKANVYTISSMLVVSPGVVCTGGGGGGGSFDISNFAQLLEGELHP